jgi:hypothetical protein
VGVDDGRFELRRNVGRKGRVLFPVLRGAVHPAAGGSVIEVTVRPHVGFWLMMSPALGFLAFLPFGPLAWLLGTPMSGGNLLMFIAIPILGMLITWWVWVPPLVVAYVAGPRYRRELTRLLEPKEQRSADLEGLLEVAEPAEQRARTAQRRQHSARDGVRVVAALLAVLGLGFASVGASGLVSGEVRIHGSRRHRGDASAGVTLRGDAARFTAQSLLSVGSGLIVCGVVGWRRAGFATIPFVARDLLNPPWSLLDAAFLACAVVMFVTAAVQGVRASLF